MSHLDLPPAPPEADASERTPIASPWPPPASPAVDFRPSPNRRRRHLRARMAAAAAAVAILATAGIVVSNGSTSGSGTTPSAGSSALPTIQALTQSTQTLTPSAIFDKVDPAIVDVNTTVSGGAAAGTGMVLTSSGLVLTNHHVIEGATSIEVQIEGTGPTYKATVLGYDATDDIALLQLANASNLTTISVGNPDALQVGDTVVAIGNALGADGPHAVTTGSVTGLDQSVTAATDDAGESETLNGLIASDAGLQPGDSGGPLINASGAVIGMNTIGTVTSRRASSRAGGGYAIPIDEALTIAQQIVDGKSSSTVQIGDRGVLGIQVQDTGSGGGVIVAGVQDGGPAAKAGVQSGDTVTAIDGTSVGTLDDLQQAMTGHHPGDKVSVTWTTAAGDTRTATITLVAGPPA